ncbi:hypothetical protein H5410_042694 [Solanum commersonii]|uniref:Uncharacterized protein n=1 Tax=Solanum commersonii TaxID=4109 RepID=A0A9J5XYD4_SOLCO|nr:hypothetical protein H5410_042694 [Solanum commersonii]
MLDGGEERERERERERFSKALYDDASSNYGDGRRKKRNGRFKERDGDSGYGRGLSSIEGIQIMGFGMLSNSVLRRVFLHYDKIGSCLVGFGGRDSGSEDVKFEEDGCGV